MFKEFKAFALKGNVMDMAVGVIVGGAFGKIITSLVNDVIMPLIGSLLGGVNLTSLKWVISPAVMSGETVVKAENALLYGRFLQNTLDFLIIAMSVFMMVKLINRLTRITKRPKKEQAPSAPPAPTQEQLLTQIRDLLAEQRP